MSERQKRFLEIDALRGIAALGVVLFHYTTQYDKAYDHPQTLLFNFPYGEYGVEIFFIISGFVILMSLERSKRGLDFLVGRFSRLYPTYWACVILTFLVLKFDGFPDSQVRWYDFFVNLTMFQAFFKVPNMDGSYWTLGVELSFYIIMFALYKANLLRYLNKVILGWLFLLFLAALAKRFGLIDATTVDSRIVTFLFLGKSYLTIYANLFIIGMMFYKVYNEGFSKQKLFVILCCLLIYDIQHTFKETLLIGLFILMFHLVLKGGMRFLAQKPLLFLGTISYSLYLIHQKVGFSIIRRCQELGMNSQFGIAIALLLSILLASLITFSIERPLIRLIRESYKARTLEQGLNNV